MASVDSKMFITLKVDIEELEQAIYRLKSGLDVRTKCPIANCSKQGLEKNGIQTTLDKDEAYPLLLLVCDEHYEALRYLNGSEV